MKSRIGYCTNVHAGAGLEQTKQNLDRYAVAVREHASPDGPLPVGLWLAAVTARELVQDNQITSFRDWLNQRQLRPYTLNGFPYGNFHQSVVKHNVYSPTWFELERESFTQDLIRILSQLLPAGSSSTISTLPIAWRASADQMRSAAQSLARIARELEQLEQDTGTYVQVCLEPEPGCALTIAQDVVDFFERYLDPAGNAQSNRRYIGVCHDVCHTAVMFGDQSDDLRLYYRKGIQVGKVQISSAVVIDWDRLAEKDHPTAVRQLRGFAEDRYLHQTNCLLTGDRSNPDRSQLFEDLPDAMTDAGRMQGQWRVHFHVPIYVESFGLLETSQADIHACLQAVKELPYEPQLEVETYAWGVLPAQLQPQDLALGIAEEINWLNRQLGNPISA